MPLGAFGRISGQVGRQATEERRRGGLLFFFLLVYLVLEYARPAEMLHLPVIISVVLFLGWLARSEKKWNGQTKAFLALLALMAWGTLFAPNDYWAAMTTRTFAILFFGTCIPLMHVADSVRRLRILVVTWVGTFAYVGIYAALHDGFGPGGVDAAQDENYIGVAMSIAFAFAYFAVLAAKRGVAKALGLAACGVFITATMAGASRGGFLAMSAVVLYCLGVSPKKKQAFMVGGLLCLVVLLVTPETYWDEMASMIDPREPTVALRLEVWTIAWRMYLANPVTGVGPSNFRWNSPAYQSERQYEKFGRGLIMHTHSMYFELLADLGTVGGILFVWILLRNILDIRWVVKRATERLARMAGADDRQARETRAARYYALAIGGSLLGALVGGVSLSFLYFTYIWVLSAMAGALRNATAGWAMSADQPVRPEPEAPWYRLGGDQPGVSASWGAEGRPYVGRT